MVMEDEGVTIFNFRAVFPDAERVFFLRSDTCSLPACILNLSIQILCHLSNFRWLWFQNCFFLLRQVIGVDLHNGTCVVKDLFLEDSAMKLCDLIPLIRFLEFVRAFALSKVTIIARGDVPLSIVIMTMCITLAAILLTPLLTKILAGTYVSVDAVKLSMSTLQVVVAPILLVRICRARFQ